MSAVTLALYKPHRWYDVGGRMICWWTHSAYSPGVLAEYCSMRNA